MTREEIMIRNEILGLLFRARCDLAKATSKKVSLEVMTEAVKDFSLVYDAFDDNKRESAERAAELVAIRAFKEGMLFQREQYEQDN